jgi:hypothetical protein
VISVFGVHRVMLGLLSMIVLATVPASAEDLPSEEPLAVFAMQFPWRGASFGLDVSANGEAEFRVGRDRVRRRTLTVDDMACLRRLVTEHKILALRAEYGTCYIDGLLRVMRVTLGTRTVQISLCSLEPDSMPVVERDEARRALRLWVAIRKLFPETYREDDRADDAAVLGEQ